jgi:hypothetical protein
MDVPPLPQRPALNEKPRGSWLTIALAGFFGFVVILVLPFLPSGFFGRLAILSLILFSVIGLQYLLWGWVLERVYRSQEVRDDEKP